MEQQHSKESGRTPLWGWILFGWLVAGTAVAWGVSSDEPSPAQEAAAAEAEIDWDLETMSPRELRTLPDVGTKRAVEIVDQRWQGKLDDPATKAVEVNLEAVPGIGPKTDHSVRRFIQQRRMNRPYPFPRNVPPHPSRRPLATQSFGPSL